MDDERLHTTVGLILLPLVAVVFGLVLWLGQRPLRPVVHLAADFDRVGMLQPGGKVMMANMVVGRVKHITFVEQVKHGKRVRRVRVYFYVEKRFARQVWINSPAYVSSMSLIGERHLEIDAPPGKPARRVHGGDVLVGNNPSRMDRLLKMGYDNLVAASDLGDAVKPHWKKVRAHLANVEKEYDRLESYRDRVEALGKRTEAVVKEARRSVNVLRASTDDFRALDRIGNRFDAFGRRAKAGAKPLVKDVERLLDRLELLAKVMRQRVPKAIEHIKARSKSITSRFKRVERWLAAVQRAVKRGDGTIGAFMKEKELWDDFKKSGRVIRQEIWNTIARRKKTSVKNSPVVP